jgi:hypothetical protein
MAKNQQDALIEAAKETVKDGKARWDKFRTESAQTLDDYVDQSVGYAQEVLDDESSPRDWVKGGVALWIQGFGTTRSLLSSASRLLFPKAEDEA